MDAIAEILSYRRQRLSDDMSRTPLAEMERLAKNAPAPLDFFGAVVRPGWITLIAEMKRKSPSAGPIRPSFDPAEVGEAYERGGAAALSVLTEPDRFGGDIADVVRAKTRSRLPVLRKDFIFDAYQIAEARAKGADAVLLIADMLSPAELSELTAYAIELGLEPLVEIFTEDVLDAALRTGARLIGINSRNLRSLEMRHDNVARLAPRVPGDRSVVAESGIKTATDVHALRGLPIAAMLVGESLLKQNNLESAARLLSDAGAPSMKP